MAGRLAAKCGDAAFSICDEVSKDSSSDDDRAVDGEGMFFLRGIGGGIRSLAVGESGVGDCAVSAESSEMSTVNRSPPAKRAGADDFFINRFGNAGG